MNLTVREYRESDAEALLELRNGIFPPVTLDEWRAEPDLTAAVAIADTQMLGAIPLSMRRFRAGGGLILDTAFENAVGTREGMRSQGIGTQMIECARQFLHDRCNALFVYRGAERSAGYRFYAKTGHIDLHYIRTMSLAAPAGPSDIPIRFTEGKEAIFAREAELLAVFESAYSGFGGFKHRCAGYYKNALEGLIFATRPQYFYLFTVETGAGLDAYAIAGVRKNAASDARLYLLEIAARSGEPAAALLRGIANTAARDGREIVIDTSYTSPYYGILRAAGYCERTGRGMMIMAQPLDLQRLAVRAWRDVPELAEVEVHASTPGGDVTLHAPAGNTRRSVLMEMKDATLARLLMRRVRIREAIETEQMTLVGADEDDIEMLERALPFAPWIYHAIDYT